MKNVIHCFAGNATFPTSSSEDGFGQVFSSEARRSKRYMSKRTSGTFREYLKSRNIELAVTDTNSEADKTQSPNQLQPPNDLKPPSDNKVKETLMRKGSIRRPNKSAAPIKCDINGNKTVDYNDKLTELTTTPTNGKPINDTVNGHPQTRHITYLKKYDDDVGKPKTQFESTDDWYASASDMDDSDGAVSKPYGYNAVNPVLECVNQVSGVFLHFTRFLLYWLWNRLEQADNAKFRCNYLLCHSLLGIRFCYNNQWMASWN